MKNRPEFSEIKIYEEFSKYYWYCEELKTICRHLGIDSRGMKLELNHRIEEFFKRNMIAGTQDPNNPSDFFISQKRSLGQKKNLKAAQNHADKSPDKQLSLNSSLIECKFCFSQRFRNFFSEQTGISNFKFNADMVATARKVRENEDFNFTLGDMLDIYYRRKTYAKYDRSCLQWNKFVKDFCSDIAAARFFNKLKVASILWSKVRDSTREKIYKTELLEEFSKEIDEYAKIKV
ncbi:MAG: hypothetical protein IJL70_07550 [Treponema sp.]|nr:hypothetical protein [Treponema sp.]